MGMTVRDLIGSGSVLRRLALAFIAFSGLGITTQGAVVLLPFQGYLTDASGEVVPDGVRIIQFKIYDAPVAGTAVWAGEVHRASVNSGMVNVVLGSRSSLEAVDFSRLQYLEMVVDANGNQAIGPEDPPLLPRQALIPGRYSIEAGVTRKLRAGDGSAHDWSALFGVGDPASAPIRSTAFGVQSIPAFSLAGNIGADKLAPGAALANLLPQSIGTDRLADGSVTAAKLSRDDIVALRELLREDGQVVGFRSVEDSVAREIPEATPILVADRTPTIDEGVEVLRLEYHPKRAGNELLIEGRAWASEEANITSSAIATLFLDGDPLAIAVAATNQHEAGVNRNGGGLAISKSIEVKSKEKLVFILRSGPGERRPQGSWHLNRMALWVGGGWDMIEFGEPDSPSAGFTSYLRVTEFHRESKDDE